MGDGGIWAPRCEIDGIGAKIMSWRIVGGWLENCWRVVGELLEGLDDV